MTPEELDAIEARANAATKGPWLAFPGSGMVGAAWRSHGWVADVPRFLSPGVNNHRVADAEFIAHARTDVPSLVAELRKAWGERL
jgi:hypothetical protein